MCSSDLGALKKSGALDGGLDEFVAQLERDFRLEQFVEQLADLEAVCRRNVGSGKFGDYTKPVIAALEETFKRLQAEAPELFAPGAKRKSDFFRDLAGSRYMSLAEAAVAKEPRLSFDRLVGLFDKTILEVENLPSEEDAFSRYARAAVSELAVFDDDLRRDGYRVEDVDQEPVGDRIEHPPVARLRVEPPRQLAVEEVGDRREREDDRGGGRCAAIGADHQRREHGHGQQPQRGQDVRDMPDRHDPECRTTRGARRQIGRAHV